MPDAMTPRSKDVTPLDFFLWGSVKDSVYVLPLPQSIEELKDRISAAIETISADLLDKVHSCLRKRLLLLVKTGGGILKMNKAFIFISLIKNYFFFSLFPIICLII